GCSYRYLICKTRNSIQKGGNQVDVSRLPQTNVAPTQSDAPYLDALVIGDFAARLRGELLRKGDAGYDEHRKVWNGMIDRYPLLIARCTCVEDVVASVNFAR